MSEYQIKCEKRLSAAKKYYVPENVRKRIERIELDNNLITVVYCSDDITRFSSELEKRIIFY